MVKIINLGKIANPDLCILISIQHLVQLIFLYSARAENMVDIHPFPKAESFYEERKNTKESFFF